jgi:hypothetical protein
MRKFSVSVNDSIIESYCYFRSLNLLSKFKSFWCFHRYLWTGPYVAPFIFIIIFFLRCSFGVNSSSYPCRVSDMITNLYHVRNPAWIETTAWLYLLYICHTVLYILFSLKTHINIYLQELTTLYGAFCTSILRFADDIFENSN